MKRAGTLYPKIADMDNLRLAFLKARRGKRLRADARDYEAQLDANLLRLRRSLLDQTVKIGDYRRFTVYDPKEREICAARFEERVLHHAIMNLCEPVFEKGLIDDVYACRTGKGTHAAVERARYFTKRYDFYLKMDIRKYFDSIDHSVMSSLLQRRFKDRALLGLFDGILKAYQTAPGRGLPIGNLTSQHFANSYLGPVDRLVKETLRIRGYVRYMDDFILWSNDRASLRSAWREIEVFARERLKLGIKNSARIGLCAKGVPFLGYRVFGNRICLSRDKKRRFERRVAALRQEWLAGSLGPGNYSRRLEALFRPLGFARCRQFKMRILKKHDFGAAP